MQHSDEVDATAATSRNVLASLPSRTMVLEREIELARRQLNGYARSLRHDGITVGEEIEPPAEGEMRNLLLAEIERLERHLEALNTPVVMPDLVLGSVPTTHTEDGQALPVRY